MIARLYGTSPHDWIAWRWVIGSLGHWGDSKTVGGDVTELRVHAGPGYRVYCWQDGDTLVVLLCGGNKSTQSRDIARAQAMVKDLKE